MLLDSDRTKLRHMREAAEEAHGYVAEMPFSRFASERVVQRAVVRCIEIVGEAAARLSPDLRDRHPEVPWADIVAMRNRIVHAYFDIDLFLVYRTATVELPGLVAQLDAIEA